MDEQKNKKQIELLEKSRERMHRTIDEQYDSLVERLLNGESIQDIRMSIRTHYLGLSPHELKGTKPLSVSFPDERVVITDTWKKVATVLLQDCNEKHHEQLMQLQNGISGKVRVLLGSDPSKMDAPLKIDEGLYFEGKLDTEMLIKVMTNHIFDRVGYDYNNIQIQFLNRLQKATAMTHGEDGVSLMMKS